MGRWYEGPASLCRYAWMMLELPLRWIACLLVALSPAAVRAQEQVNVPAQIMLGRRGEQPRAGIAVLPTLVIVDSPEAYAQAVGSWNTDRRFPVLLDDGSVWATQAIGRFAHAFHPDRIVRWTPEQLDPLPPQGPERQRAFAALQAHAWAAPEDNPDQLMATWNRGGWMPPAVVIADDADPAWTAALALGIGRALPIVWVESLTTPIDHETNRAHADMLSKAASGWAEANNVPWDIIGDALDAITICLNDPARVKVGPDDTLALTDLVGRHADDRRWAWASQIFGNEARSAYMAMCSLFIQPRSAWIFDAYPSEDPWDQWDGTAASEIIRSTTIGDQPMFPDIKVHDEPTQGLAAWRLGSRTGIGGSTGGLVLVNTSGNSDFFTLKPGRGRPGDIPEMLSPTLVHFVHSWSALFPSKRETLAGRWFERGAFAYVGAVQEPGLAGFVPTPTFVARMLNSSPLAASARNVSTKPGRVAVFGDAMYSIGPQARRVPEAELPLSPVVDLGDVLKEAASGRDWVTLFRTLELRGEFSRISKLAQAMLRDQPDAITPSIARAALFSVSTHSEPPVVFELYRKLLPSDARSGWARDLLWNSARRGVPMQGVPLLTANVRTDQEEVDRKDLAKLTGQR